MSKDLIQFGTDGWRGKIAEDFTFINIRRVSGALGRLFPKRSRVVVGYDGRFLSKEFAWESARVLSSMDHRVLVSSESITSPALSFSVKNQKAVGGVMITASHNPSNYNGFKIKCYPGFPADASFTSRLEKELFSSESVDGVGRGNKIKLFSPIKNYMDFLISKVNLRVWKKRGFKIIADGMHGSGGDLLKRILLKVPVKEYLIRNNTDPLFGGIHPEPIEKNLAELKKEVIEKKAWVGVALDGDGDRLGVVDDKGEYVSPHEIFPLILLHLIENRRLKGKILQGVSMGYLPKRIADHFGLEWKEIPVGFKHAVPHIQKGGVLAVGEESGSYGIGLWAPERDGMLSGLLLLEMISCFQRPLSFLRKQLAERFGRSFFRRKDFSLRSSVVPQKNWMSRIKDDLPQKINGHKWKEFREIDGVKAVLDDDSWLLFRSSGTEPLIRVYAESPHPHKTHVILKAADKVLAGKKGLGSLV